MPDDPYSLGDLARLADVTPRTVRYYVAQGLLPSPEAAGPATRYGEGHLARLRLIRRLQRDHLPLAEIRARLERMGDEEVAAAAAVLDAQEPEPSLEAEDTLGFVRSLMRQAGLRPTVAERAAVIEPAAAIEPAAVSEPAPGAEYATGAKPATGIGPPAVLQLARASPAAWLDVEPDPGPKVASPAPAPGVPAPDPTQDVALDGASPVATASPPPGPRTQPDRSTWERLVIAPDVEIHVRRPLDRPTNKRVDQLERIARELFEDT